MLFDRAEPELDTHTQVCVRHTADEITPLELHIVFFIPAKTPRFPTFCHVLTKRSDGATRV